MSKPSLPIYFNGSISSEIAETPFGGIWEVSIAFDIDGVKFMNEGDIIAALSPCFRYRRSNPRNLDPIQNRLDDTDFGYFDDFEGDVLNAIKGD